MKHFLADPPIPALTSEGRSRLEARAARTSPAEVSVGENRISAASPLGHALLGRGVGDRVVVQAPAGTYSGTIQGRRRLA
jgi:hypothetical protein